MDPKTVYQATRRYLWEKDICVTNCYKIVEARHELSGRLYVVKRENQSALAQTTADVPSLNREREVLALIQSKAPDACPNIAKIEDHGTQVGEKGGLSFIVIEYVNGGSLSRQAAVADDVAARLAITLLQNIGEALSVAHSAQIVHNDVHLRNILFEGDDLASVSRLVLCDFDHATNVGTTHFRPKEVPKIHRGCAIPWAGPDASDDLFSHATDVYMLAYSALKVAVGCLSGEILPGDLTSAIESVGDQPLRELLKKALVSKPENVPSAANIAKWSEELLGERPAPASRSSGYGRYPLGAPPAAPSLPNVGFERFADRDPGWHRSHFSFSPDSEYLAVSNASGGATICASGSAMPIAQLVDPYVAKTPASHIVWLPSPSTGDQGASWTLWGIQGSKLIKWVFNAGDSASVYPTRFAYASNAFAIVGSQSGGGTAVVGGQQLAYVSRDGRFAAPNRLRVAQFALVRAGPLGATEELVILRGEKTTSGKGGNVHVTSGLAAWLSGKSDMPVVTEIAGFSDCLDLMPVLAQSAVVGLCGGDPTQTTIRLWRPGMQRPVSLSLNTTPNDLIPTRLLPVGGAYFGVEARVNGRRDYQVIACRNDRLVVVRGYSVAQETPCCVSQEGSRVALITSSGFVRCENLATFHGRLDLSNT